MTELCHTPPRYVELARKVIGGIDDDRVFVNPISLGRGTYLVIEKLVAAYQAGN